jgi:hypothetical protein
VSVNCLTFFVVFRSPGVRVRLGVGNAPDPGAAPPSRNKMQVADLVLRVFWTCPHRVAGPMGRLQIAIGRGTASCISPRAPDVCLPSDIGGIADVPEPLRRAISQHSLIQSLHRRAAALKLVSISQDSWQSVH